MIEFETKKAENCFSDAQTWEYRISCGNEALLPSFEKLGSLTIKSNLRRPVFLLHMKDGTRVKGTIKGSLLRASFPTEKWEKAKSEFETALLHLLEEEGSDGTGI